MKFGQTFHTIYKLGKVLTQEAKFGHVAKFGCRAEIFYLKSHHLKSGLLNPFYYTEPKGLDWIPIFPYNWCV